MLALVLIAEKFSFSCETDVKWESEVDKESPLGGDALKKILGRVSVQQDILKLESGSSAITSHSSASTL